MKGTTATVGAYNGIMTTRLTTRGVTLAAATLLVVAGLAPSSASACSCAIPDVAAARSAATAVFEGEVVRVVAGDSDSPTVVVLRVSRIWKGAVRREVRVRSDQPSMCPPHLTVGERFIVYAAGTEAALEVRACSRWAQGDRLADERRSLGRPIRTF